MDQAKPTSATDASANPAHLQSDSEPKDPTPPQDHQVAGDVQTGQGGSFPEQSEGNEDPIVSYHWKGKGAKPLVKGKPN